MSTRREHATCPTCYGSGRMIVNRAAVINGRVGTAGVNEPCKDCGGSGYLTFEVTSPPDDTA